MLLQLLVLWYLWSAIYLMLSTHNSERTTIDHIFMHRLVSRRMYHYTNVLLKNGSTDELLSTLISMAHF